MGCVNGKPVLSDEDLDFIATHTAVTRDEVDKQYENFLAKHPDGRIRKKEFRAMMQVRHAKKCKWGNSLSSKIGNTK